MVDYVYWGLWFLTTTAGGFILHYRYGAHVGGFFFFCCLHIFFYASMPVLGFLLSRILVVRRKVGSQGG